MADRSTLALSKLEEFAEWAVRTGHFVRVPTKGHYEVLRLVRRNGIKGAAPLLYYRKDTGGQFHATAQRGAALGLVKRWLRRRDQNE